MWIGTRGQMEEELVPRAGLHLETIRGGPIAGVSPAKKMMNSAQLAWSMQTSARLIRRFRPHVLLLTGGYVNVPVALVARAMRVPAAIYLPDIEPGSAIRFLSRFVEKVASTAAESRAYFPDGKVVVTGYPVRPELRAAAALSRAEALAAFGLDTTRPALFVFGGSRGARSINRALLAVLPAAAYRIPDHSRQRELWTGKKWKLARRRWILSCARIIASTLICTSGWARRSRPPTWS
jgi:UDP-N-acetylglucosamine--N-acetylmuramyl-(pentapeptide) pyrophosphoryl-undecaprenol N-acetylglucosamine transferase